ncbi:cytochrome P450 [Streptomyces kronopolitis]|uniref:cytochrome P450 n=1 Tax=Streptomyces kronopolitis TaxID=1612435 RepID=UPI003430CA2F
MTDTTAALGAAEPVTPEFPLARKCPYQMPPGYEGLRERGPLSNVSLWDGRRAWLVTGNAEGRELFPDPRLSSDVLNPAFPLLAPRIAAQREQQMAPPLVGVDDPVHARQRKMVIPGFGSRRVNALRSEIQRIADGLIDNMLSAGDSADLLSSYALPLPSAVVCALLGVPYEERSYFEERSRHVLSSAGPDQAELAERSFTEILRYLHDLIGRKENEPGEGLLDDLTAQQLAEGTVNRDELAMIAALLLVSGHETTSNMIALSTMALLDHPDQLAVLRADPSLWPGAVDELMRFTSIGDTLVRLAIEDIEIAGQVIEAGDAVVLSTMLMNRDPSSWEKPDELDIRRAAGRHVAFGYGIHQCIGQNLARAEMEIALSTLFARMPRIRLAVPAERIPVNAAYVLQGVSELPVTW